VAHITLGDITPAKGLGEVMLPEPRQASR